MRRAPATSWEGMVYPAIPAMATTMSTAGEMILASTRRAAHHQAADDRHGLPDGLGQAEPRLLENLKGQQQDDDLKDGAEGYVLLGGQCGQGQAGWESSPGGR